MAYVRDIIPSDEDLALNAQAGSRHDFDLLVRRYQVPLLQFLQRRARGRHDAEDLLQATFLRAYEAIDQYNQRWRFKTWLFTISYRLAMSEFRKPKLSIAPDDPGGCCDCRPSPGLRLEQIEGEKNLWQIAKRELSPEQFAALWLHYAESMPAPQIAKVLGRSWVWVKTNLHRSRRILHLALTSEGAEAPAFPSISQPSLAAGVEA